MTVAPGASIAKAQADLDLVNRQLKQADPGRWGLGAVVTERTGRSRASKNARSTCARPMLSCCAPLRRSWTLSSRADTARHCSMRKNSVGSEGSPM